MHVVVHIIPVKPDTLDRARALFEAKVPPLAAGFSAWGGARLLATDDNQLVTVGLWHDEAQMRQFLTQPAFAQAMGSFADLITGAPTAFITQQITAVGPIAA